MTKPYSINEVMAFSFPQLEKWIAQSCAKRDKELAQYQAEGKDAKLFIEFERRESNEVINDFIDAWKRRHLTFEQKYEEKYMNLVVW